MSDAFQIPPNNPDAECSLLASLMLCDSDAGTFAECLALVNRESFYTEDHGKIFDVIAGIFTAGRKIDAVSVRAELQRAKLLEEVGGTAYLAKILESIPSWHHASEYARILREQWQLRESIRIGNEMIRAAYAPGAEAREILERSQGHIGKSIASAAGGARKISEILVGVREQLCSGLESLISSGFPAIDAVGGGVGLGEMFLVGARPSMGKSTLLRQICLRSAKAGIPTLLISLEEGEAKIGRNILAAESMVENRRLRTGKDLGPEQWREIDDGIMRLASAPLFITDRTRSLSDVRAEIAIGVARHKIQIVAVDYLQRISAPGKDRYERVSNASQGLSFAFKDFNVAGWVAVQLNRSLEQRDDKHPTMSDIRESGTIEQDADGILFLHREDYYHLHESGYQPNEIAELGVAKWRDSVRGRVIKLRSNLRFQCFEDTVTATDDFPEEVQAAFA